MKPREMVKYLEENGFQFLRRNGGGHPIYSDGTSSIAMYAGNPKSWRAGKNLVAEVNRAIRKRPPTVVKPQEESIEMRIETHNKTRAEAMTAPGAAPLANGHAKEPLVALADAPEKIKRKKYDPITKRKLEGRIMALYAEGHHEASDIHRALVAEGFPDASGEGLVGMERARYFLNMLLETGVIKQVVVPPKVVAQPVAAATRGPSRMPDSCMGILTDPGLTAEQKVRMLLAYVEL